MTKNKGKCIIIFFLAMFMWPGDPGLVPAQTAVQGVQAGQTAEAVPNNEDKTNLIKTYYLNGMLREEFTNNEGRRHGIYREYDPAGMLKKEIDYIEGEIREIRNYDQNRQLIIKILKEKIADPNRTEKSNLEAFHTCFSEEAGVRFACNPHWRLSRTGKILTITVSLVPQVDIVIEETEIKLKTIDDLSRDAVLKLDRFEEGFDMQQVARCGRETINVSGYMIGEPNVKVSEFFMLDHRTLHSVQFTVDPAGGWPEYEGLFDRIMESMEFTGQKEPVKFHLEATDENCEELVE